MRAVDYITNGFGGFSDDIQKITAEIRPTGNLGQVLDNPAAKINAFMVSTNADPTLRMVAVQTAQQRGLAGIEQTVNFFSAAQSALDVAKGMVPDVVAPANIPRFPPFNDQFMAWYRTSGDKLNAQRLLKIMNIMINTASSRVGTNPLTNYLIQKLRSAMPNATSTDQANYVFSLLNDQRQLANQILRAARGY
jgi:hypothetical protein